MPITAVSRETPPASPPLHPATYEEALATAEPGDTIATTKEEEWVTRKTSEVTTTRQIATRVKRELVLEDGKILKDSGPKISTSVNEDTHTTNLQQTEHRVPDEQPAEDNTSALPARARGVIGAPPDETDGLQPLIGGVVAPAGTKVLVSSRVVANPDGKVRESKDLKVLTRNVTDYVRETEERFHRGDTTHERVVTNFDEKVHERKDLKVLTRNVTEHVRKTEKRFPSILRFHIGDTTHEVSCVLIVRSSFVLEVDDIQPLKGGVVALAGTRDVSGRGAVRWVLPRTQPPRAGLPAHVCGVPVIPRETPAVELRLGREAARCGDAEESLNGDPAAPC
ncbi:hypothetical protein evm_007161 [Chilo suppressalis]|nr:hypothetical protein evm_007161 [Chilo suppressalis]